MARDELRQYLADQVAEARAAYEHDAPACDFPMYLVTWIELHAAEFRAAYNHSHTTEGVTA